MTWQTKKLKDICLVFTDGDWIESKDQSFSGIRLIQTGNVGNLVYIDKEARSKYISEETFSRLNCTEIFPGDILVSRLPEPVGRACIVPDIGERMITAVDCTIIRPDESTIDKKYLLYFTFSPGYQSEINKNLSGTTRQRISRSALGNIEIPLPPLATQHQIVAILDEKFAKLREAKRLRQEAIGDTEKILAATLREIFENGKERGWKEDILNNVATKVADGTHDTPKYQNEGYPLVTSKNLLENGLDFSNVKYISEEDYIQIGQRSRVHKGDLLIGMIGTIGNITMVETDQEFSIKNVGLIKPDEEKVLGKYLMYFLHNSRLLSLIESKGATQKFIALGPIRNIKIQFPSLAEQKEIVTRLDVLSEKLGTLRELQQLQLDDMKKLEKTYLREAFRSELC